MVDLKEEIGKCVRQARLSKGLTQADICGDESELTVRQLTRIENGHTLLTIPKALFLASKLGVGVQELVDVEAISLPKRYLELKNRLTKTHTYGDPKRIKELEGFLDEIYEHYYDSLPEEEQLLVEVVQAQLDVFTSRDYQYGLTLLEEYFQQILKKSHYSYNDLLIINLYFFCCALGLEDKSHMEQLASRVIEDIDYSDLDRVYATERILVTLLINAEPEDYLTYTSVLRDIIERTNNFQHKPAVYAFEAKYYLLVKKDKAKAKALYDKAILFANMLNDEALAEEFIRESEKDLKT